jgi:Cupin domain
MEKIDNPVTGQVMSFVHCDAEVDELEGWFRPGGFAGPLHVHPRQDELFEVVSGRAGFEVHGERTERGPGQSIEVRRGAAHTFWNAGEEELHVRMRFMPGLPSTRAFYRFFFELGRTGRLDDRGNPPLLVVAAAIPHFGEHVRLASPPWALQRVVLTALRPIAALAGIQVPISLFDAPSPAGGHSA